MASYACFEHSNFFKVNDRKRAHLAELPNQINDPKNKDDIQSSHNRTSFDRATSQNPTTSFLTATTLIYTIGAGITAAAGTRLALQLFLVKVFKLYSFQISYPIVSDNGISCHYLPESGLGNLRACCLPWKW